MTRILGMDLPGGAPWNFHGTLTSFCGVPVQQWYKNSLLRISNRLTKRPRGRVERWQQRLLDKLCRLILRFHDPLVEREIAGSRLVMPFSHRLPLYLAWHPRYSSNLGRLARHVQDKYRDLTMIDVGANVGDSIAIVRKDAYCPVLCVEGDANFFPVLQANAARFSDVEIVRAFLGERDEELHGRSLHTYGTAHLSASAVGESFLVRRLDALLKDYPRFWNSKLIKTDTDGYDAKVLCGAAEYLETAKPVVFFEYDPDFLAEQGSEPLELLKWLQTVGYSKLIFYDNFGELLLDTETANHRQLEEITLYFTGYNAQRYCDVCAFHRVDEDVFEKMIAAELALSRTQSLPR